MKKLTFAFLNFANEPKNEKPKNFTEKHLSIFGSGNYVKKLVPENILLALKILFMLRLFDDTKQ
jgi:hypothetical protein